MTMLPSNLLYEISRGRKKKIMPPATVQKKAPKSTPPTTRRKQKMANLDAEMLIKSQLEASTQKHDNCNNEEEDMEDMEDDKSREILSINDLTVLN